MLVWVLVSQPLAALVSQLPKPALQVPSVQLPPGQVSLAFARSHSTPQLPQLAVVVSEVSQPFPVLPSQSPRPGEQPEIPHVPFTQFGVPPVAEQMLPQVPQLVMSVLRVLSQPFVALPSQLLKPALQAPSVQVPVAHDSLAFARSQVTPQPPQLPSV